LLELMMHLETNPDEEPRVAGDVRPGPGEEAGVLESRPVSTGATKMALPREVIGISILTTIGTTLKEIILGESARDGITPGTRTVVIS
jgi:hypothetical protein